MRRYLAFVAAVGLMGFGAASQANAQFGQFGQINNQPNPYQTPTLSPYLNLNRPGNAGINYFGMVRPQVDTAKQMLYLQQQQQLQQQLGISALGLADDTLTGANTAVTGHQTAWFNYGSYFGQAGGTYSPMMPPTGVTPARRQ